MTRRLVKLVDSYKTPEIDFTNPDDADPNIENNPESAIEQLDFETAEIITSNNHLTEHNALRDNANQLIMGIEETGDHLTNESQIIGEKLEQGAEIKAEDIKHHYQGKFAQLVSKHRNEAEAFKEKWIENHKRAEAAALKRIEELKSTSKVLATCECYEAAKDIRDKTTINEEANIREETDPIDSHFREQFEAMMARHKDLYRSLFYEMHHKINYYRQKAKVDHERANVDIVYQEALSPVEMMKKISNSEHLTVAEKISIIRQTSPSKLSPLNSRVSSQLIKTSSQAATPRSDK
ncbi:hypothetical protein TRFO_17665 [Tritrichomonas foetus]|uniref:Uncharacterized protein n=1 Tax=Tritrichomonas foetus TaxID=1144522 RepID=A0A1J4KMG8_9EUKA|nr:hypothetical protein TRFO_17665 [Tritrichomonas foetus]|eukprot:OHT12497.1 hypothetical protein TRFO_17665 [Tritrichomonas foetus]